MNRHLPVGLVLAGIPLFALSLLVACGDDIENTTINQTGVELFDSSEDLPECTDKNESDLIFVRGETSARICVDGEWIAMASDGSGNGNFSCKTVELKDKSGLKIVCNGDSIGVVLNGSDGKDGKDAELPRDTLEVDSEKIVISLDSLVGVTQKGPFLKGSTVYLYELSDGRTLKQTNGNFTSNITSNDGRYKFTARDLVSQYAMVVVDGYYRNEVTGKTSDAPIRLKAITDMRKRTSVNVNLLTQLEFNRVYSLVTRGDKDGNKLTVKQAKRQAQKEILRQFHIELDDNADAEDMDVFGKTDADAALLAVSVLLQGDGGSTDLSVLLTEISNAIAEKGEWKDSAAKARIADWALKADTEKRLAKFRKNVADWRLGDTVPGFEKFVRNYMNVVTGLGECGNEKTPVGTFAHVPNVNSAYFALAYDSIDVTKNSLVRFVCDAEGGDHWRMATALERDTRGWEAAEDGAVQMGQIDTSIVYVYDGGWRQGTELDRQLGLGCTQERKDTQMQYNDSVWYRCVAGTTWVLTDDLERENIYFEEHKDSLGTLLTGPISGKVVVWDAGIFREANEREIALGMGCVSYMREQKYLVPRGVKFTCSNGEWSKTGSMADMIYAVTLIGNQLWMAQNLHENYVVKSNEYGIYYEYGAPYYTWAAAMDSAGIYTNNGKGCGYEGRSYCGGTIRGICPEGWHLPSIDDWNTLFANVKGGQLEAGFHLKSQTGWKSDGNGDDLYTFSARPLGHVASAVHGSYFFSLREDGSSAYFWTSTGGAYEATAVHLDAGDKALMNKEDVREGKSIRCVKD